MTEEQLTPWTALRSINAERYQILRLRQQIIYKQQESVLPN